MINRKRVAVIFDRAGHPTQPFLTDWFARLGLLREVEVRGFTDYFYEKPVQGITALKDTSKTEKIIRPFSRWRREIGSPVYLRPIEKFDPHVIHLLNAQQIDQYMPVVKPGRKLVVSFRGYETSVRPTTDADWSRRLQALYREADKLHFVSDFLRNEAIGKGAIPDKCVVIRRAVDTDFFRPADRAEKSEIRILAVGRLTWQKGYRYLIDAFRQDEIKSKSELTIVGSGSLLQELQLQITNFDLNKKVKIIDSLSRSQLVELYNQSDLFAQASVSEALPNSILEACACGLPVVSTWAGGIPEAVVNNKTGILVQPEDSYAFAKALLQLINSKRLRHEFGEAGRHFVQNNFGSKRELDCWENVFLESV